MSPARPAATNAPPGPLACTDAERRAARRHASALRAAGRTVRVEPLWVRPARAAALAACAAAGVAASVLSVDHPVAALVVAGVALVLALAELGSLPLLRRLTFARATQNVLSAPAAPRPVTLVLIAAADRPRAGVLHRARIPAGPVTAAALALVTACVAARVAFDAGGTLLGALQLVPTAVLVLAVGGLVDAAVAAPAPADGRAVDAVVDAAKRLDAAPPGRVAVETVLAGAWPLGLHARLKRDRRRPDELVVAIVAPGAEPRYATRHPTLRAIADSARHAERRGRAPRAGRRPVIAMSGPPEATTELLVALAAGIDAEIGGQPTSSERAANSTK
jgi:hypothetical protein